MNSQLKFHSLNVRINTVYTAGKIGQVNWHRGSILLFFLFCRRFLAQGTLPNCNNSFKYTWNCIDISMTNGDRVESNETCDGWIVRYPTER